MSNKTCQLCELDIKPIRQLSQQEIDLLSNYMDVSCTCEWCMIAKLGELEYPDEMKGKRVKR